MFCTQRKWCDLVVRTQDIHIERIIYNDEFWASVMPKLKTFYFTAVYPNYLFLWGSQPYENHQMNLKRSGRTFLNIYRLMHACLYYVHYITKHLLCTYLSILVVINLYRMVVILYETFPV